MVILQASDHAILNLDPEWEAGLLDGSLKIELPGPNSKTLIRMDAVDPVRLMMKLNEGVEGRPFMVIPSKGKSGEIVELPNSQNDTTAAVELKAHGNISALAIRKEGSLKANAKPKFLPIPPKLSESVKIKD